MNAHHRAGILAGIFAGCLATVTLASHLLADAEAQGDSPGAATVNATATIPPGPQGELIAYGRDIVTDTPKYASSFISARLSCAACHPGAGTQPHAGSFLGIYALFPQWNKRANRFIALQDRLAECFLYSMNGHPPAYYSREMVALTAYIAWLSRGAPTGIGFADQEPVTVNPPKPPDVTRGQAVYAARCISCHGADGNGSGITFPPLWGPQSFNDEAGMSHIDRIAPFIKVAMPQNAPGTLSDQEAADVAAYVLIQPRPHFNKDRHIEFPGENAGYF